jgi:CRP-like cAMP-binding protein
MSINIFEQGHVIFREGDQATRFYIISTGAVEIHKNAGRFAGSRVVSSVTPDIDRPWFGEVALWLRKPRGAPPPPPPRGAAACCARLCCEGEHDPSTTRARRRARRVRSCCMCAAGSAVVTSETCRVLVIDEMDFDAFLAMVPDFRPYVNKNHRQVTQHTKKGGSVTLEAAAAEEERLHTTTAVTATWQSGGRLGGRTDLDATDRSLFAERWERIVTALLYLPGADDGERGGGGRGHSTVSFRTADYVFNRQ